MPPVKHEEGARVHDEESPDSKKSGVNRVRDAVTKKGAITMCDLLLKPNSVSWIQPGSTELDELLGVMASDFTDNPLGHPSWLEKTNLAHTLCVTSQLSTGMQEDIGKIAYIDTEGTFEPEMLVKIAEILGVDVTPLLLKMVYARAYTYEDMEDLLSGLQAKIEKDHIKFLIINSMTMLFNMELINGYTIDGCQVKALEMIDCLKMIVNTFDITVYITNHDELSSADDNTKRSLKLARKGPYFMEVNDLRKMKNSLQVTTGNNVLGDMHQGGLTRQGREIAGTETVCANSQKLRGSIIKVRISCPDYVFYIEASPDDTIQQLLKIIEKRTSLPQESFYLTYLGSLLDPDKTLRENRVGLSLVKFELHPRLRGGCPDNGNISLREFVANNSVNWSTRSHGRNLYSNRLVKEVLVRYPGPPGNKGMQEAVKLVMQPLAIKICNGILHHVQMAHSVDMSWNGSISLETFRMVGGVMEVSQAASEGLDDKSVLKDYEQVSELFIDMLELNKNRPIYLDHLCKHMKSADVTSAKSSSFQLFLRAHPSLMTYSTRSPLLWETQRELKGLQIPAQKNVEIAIDQIKIHRPWTDIVNDEAAMLPTLNNSYKLTSCECFRFIRNWLTHGKENFNDVDSRRFTTEHMDYLLEIHFRDFLPDLFWTLIQQNILDLNRWFEEVQDNNSF